MFYLVLMENDRVVITPHLKAVQEPAKIKGVLAPAAPLGFIVEVVGQTPRSERWWFFSRWQTYKERLLRAFQARCPQIPWQWRDSPEGEAATGSGGLSLPLIQDIEKLTTHRILSKRDLQRLAQELGVTYDEVLFGAQMLVERGQAQFVPAIVPKGDHWQCRRCGSTAMHEWPSIYGQAVTCQECSALGSLSSLDFLFLRQSGPESRFQPAVNYRPSRRFSPAQAAAATQVLEFMQNPGKRRLLLWAACGAGKTEVVFPALAWALREKQNVMFAAPRQDVVEDIAPRIKRDFPGLKVQVLTGSSPRRFDPGQLLLATTHQVLRFHRGFDLVILDEIDAFPYHGSRMLEWGVERALRPEGKIIYLTATPSRALRGQARSGQIDLVRIPARHHGYPLPVPEWHRHEGLDRGQADPLFCGLLLELLKAGPVLVFVPTVDRVEHWVKEIREVVPDRRVTGSHSQDPKRRSKVEKFCRGGYDVFVSTTILERGVTVPGVQVMVLQADHPLFDERVLVQMAGRVGRTAECPTGKVLFLAAERTPVMEEAVQWIEAQNRLAQAQGLIKGGVLKSLNR